MSRAPTARARHLAGLALALATVVVGPAAAQDDWSIERDDRPTRPHGRPRGPGTRPPRAEADLPARYLGIVLADPREGFAMDRLVTLFREGAGLEALASRLEAERAAHPDAVDLVLARLDRERGDPDAARARYAAVTGTWAWLGALGLYHLDRPTDPAAARAQLTRAIELAPRTDREDLVRLLAELCLDLGDYDAAERHYGELGTGARSVHLRTELARALAARGEHARALAAYRTVAAALRGDRRVLAPILVEVAREALALDRIDEALESLDEARAAASPTDGVRSEIAELFLTAHRRAGTLAELATAWASSRAPGELLGRARALDELGRDDEAIEAYGRVIRVRRTDVEPRLGQIQVLLRAARIDEAIVAYEGLLRVARRPAYVTALAQLLDANGRGVEARELLARTVRSARAGDGPLLEAVAVLSASWGDEAGATAALERRAALSPDDPVAIVALGDQLLAAGDAEGADRVFRRVLDIGDGASAHAALGAVLLDHDRLDAAIAELAEAIALGRAAGHVELETLRLHALALERAGRSADTEAAWRAVLAEAAGEPALAREAREHVVAGWARSRTLDRHVPELRAAFTAEPPDLDAGHFLALALQRRGDVEGAVTTLRRIADLRPTDVETLELLERLEVQRGELAGAIDALERLARAEPRRAAAYHRRMAEHALAIYRDDDAVRYARRAVELAPDDAEGWSSLAELLASRGDRAEALVLRRRAVELAPRDWDLALVLADEEAAAGERAGAQAQLLRIAEGCPDDALVREAIRRSLDLSGADTAALASLEAALLAQVIRSPERVALRRSYLELLGARARPLLFADDVASQAELARVVGRGLSPLLLAIGSSDPAEASAAIELVRAARVRGASGALLGRAEREGDPLLRLEALAAYAGVAVPEHRDRLAALAASGDLRLRRLAIWALGRAVSGAARTRALTPFLADVEPEIQAMAAVALGGVDGTEPVSLASPPAGSPIVSWALARDLPRVVAGRLGLPGEAATPLVLLALARSLEPSAQRVVALALLEPGTRAAAARALRSARSLDPSAAPEPGEDTAAFVLRALGSAPVDVAMVSRVLAEVLPAALTEREGGAPTPRALAALALLAVPPSGPRGLTCDGVTGTGERLDGALEAAIRPALDALTTFADANVRARAVALSAAGPRRHDAAFFERVFADPAPAVVRAALEARGGGELGDVAPAVVRLLAHPDWAVRRAAALAVTGEPTATAPLVALLEDPYALVRDAAVRALAPVASADAGVRAALEAVCAGDPEARVRALAAELAPCD